MRNPLSFHRRQFLGGAAALGVSALGLPAESAVSPSVGGLPGRGHVVIRNAYVMTMVAGAADLPNGDVRVENGAIAEVGTGLAAPGAEVIDGEGFILMPGLIDTHWHMWTTLLRNMSGNTPEHGYFPTTTAVGNVYTPRDMYYGTLMSAAEALFSGITTVHDWCHNIITPQHAEEDLRALQETGIRGRFSYGPARRNAVHRSDRCRRPRALRPRLEELLQRRAAHAGSRLARRAGVVP
jgi:5-methylthioadenosine/S-adenosylhomocysteine deaminase